MQKPLAIMDQFGRPMASALTKSDRLALQGGDAGYYVASNASGKAVTLSGALTISAVWGCVARSAQTMASLPIDVYTKTATGRKKVEGDLDDLIGLSPNSDQTPIEFWEGNLSWLLATGNGYSEIDRIGDRVNALLPLPKTQVLPFRNADGLLQYEVREHASRPRVVDQRDMLHLRGWGFGGDEGMSPIQWGTQSLGAAMAADAS
jgi:HK97 family phage portal protein